MKSAQANAGRDRGTELLHGLFLDGLLGDDRHDQVEALQVVFVKRLRAFLDGHVEAFGNQHVP